MGEGLIKGARVGGKGNKNPCHTFNRWLRPGPPHHPSTFITSVVLNQATQPGMCLATAALVSSHFSRSIYMAAMSAGVAIRT